MTTLTLQEAADELGVHYMTAYRYVRTARLPAEKDGAAWRVSRIHLDEFIAARDTAPPPFRAARPDSWPRLRDRLIAADEQGAWKIIEEALVGGATPDEVHLKLIAPAMADIGAQWADGQLTVADEHRATVIVLRLLGRMSPLFRQRGRARGQVVLAAVAGDNHAIPTALLADLLRLDRFEVIDLGADSPTSSIASTTLELSRPIAVGLCVSDPTVVATLPDVVAEIRSSVPATPIFVGGSAVSDTSVITADSLFDDGAPSTHRPDFVSNTAREAIDFVASLAAVPVA